MNEYDCRICGMRIRFGKHDYAVDYKRSGTYESEPVYTHLECMEPSVVGDDFKEWVVYMIKELRSELGILSERIDEIGK